MLLRPLLGATSSSPDETLLEDTLTATGFQVFLGSLTATAPRIPRSRLGDQRRHDLGSARGLPGRRRSYDPAGSSPGFFTTALFPPLWRATAPVYWVLVSHSFTYFMHIVHIVIFCILCILFYTGHIFTFFAHFVYKPYFSVFRCLFPLLLGPPSIHGPSC